MLVDDLARHIQKKIVFFFLAGDEFLICERRTARPQRWSGSVDWSMGRLFHLWGLTPSSALMHKVTPGAFRATTRRFPSLFSGGGFICPARQNV